MGTTLTRMCFKRSTGLENPPGFFGSDCRVDQSRWRSRGSQETQLTRVWGHRALTCYPHASISLTCPRRSNCGMYRTGCTVA
jgi:hypothetical protein